MSLFPKDACGAAGWTVRIAGNSRIHLRTRYFPSGLRMVHALLTTVLLSVVRGAQRSFLLKEARRKTCSRKVARVWTSIGPPMAARSFFQPRPIRSPQTSRFSIWGSQQFSPLPGSEGLFSPCLSPDGRYLATDGLQNVLLTPWTARFGDKKAIFKIPPRTTQQDVDFLGDLVEEGKYRAVIDRTYPMDEVVDATRYVETEHKTGNVILTITGS